MTNVRPRISIQSLFAFTAFCAAAIPATVVPGGYIFFLPILGILALTFLWVHAFRKWKNDSKRWAKYAFALITIALLSSTVTFIALIDVAHRRFEVVRYATEQRTAALSIDDPERFRDIALELRAKLVALPSHQRIISGNSPKLPEAIRSIRPISVIASDHYIAIKMTPDGGSLIAYREDSTFPRVSCPAIVSDLFYYPY